MNQIQTEKIQYDATREAYEYAIAEEEGFNPDQYRQHIERKLDILASDAAHYCRLTNEYLALEPERSSPAFLTIVSELTEQLQERIDHAYRTLIRENIKNNQVRK